jgi:hypothetical protein
MALINETNQAYYEGNDYGNYQFVSLDTIINQFQISYVGQDKIIPRIRRADIAFHAMRAIQELSFDTFKSIKSQEITLPPSLKMILPQDYVNYTGVYFTDESGIKHPLYHTQHTSNPFAILQNDDGDYVFSDDVELLIGGDFDSAQSRLHPRWKRPTFSKVQRDGQTSAPGPDTNGNGILGFGGGFKIRSGAATSNQLQFTHVSQPINVVNSLDYDGRVLSCWQRVDVSQLTTLTISADVALFAEDLISNTTGAGNATSFSSSVPNGKIIVGIQTSPGVNNTKTKGTAQQINNNPNYLSKNLNDPDLGFIEFTSDGVQELDVDVSAHDEVYFIINSLVEVFTSETKGDGVIATQTQPTNNGTVPTQWEFVNKVNSVSCKSAEPTERLMPKNITDTDSTTWENYKSHTPNENVVIDYDYDDPRFHNLNKGQRYGLEPSHAQVNGSFYVDNLQGYINFSSNVSGKTIVLDYISDGLGTDAEMQVHKFAEEAMYKHMLCDIMSGRSGVPEYAIRRYKQEKRATKRNAKLRLSNIKLEQIIQEFRNKSKIIK